MGSLLETDRRNITALPSPNYLDIKNSIYSAVVLTASLVIIVPLLVTVGGLPTLPLVAFTGVVYAVFVTLNDMLFEGLSSALFVLFAFNANIPIIESSGPAGFSIFMLDLPLIALLFLLLWWEHTESRTQFRTATTVVIGSLGVFTVWSLISAFVANGPSQPAAFTFALAQFRYVLILFVAVLLVRRTNCWYGIYPLIIAISGNVVVGIFQTINDGPLGLSYLGEVGAEYISQVALGPFVTHSGVHIGGFTGTSRTLSGVVILVVPIVIFLSVGRSRWRALLASGFVVGAAFIVRMSGSDAAWAALLLTLVMVAVVLLYHSYRERQSRYLTGIANCALGFAVSGGLYISRFMNPSTDVSEPTESSVATSGSGSSTQDLVTDTVASIPIIQANTFPIRLQQWIISAEIASTHPLFGIGGYNFYLVSESFGLPRAFAVHNTFLAYLAATGIPGIAAYLLGIGVVLFVVLRHAIFSHDEASRVFWGLFASGIIGFHALSFWITIHNSVVAFSTFWAVCGIALAAERELFSPIYN